MRVTNAINSLFEVEYYNFNKYQYEKVSEGKLLQIPLPELEIGDAISVLWDENIYPATVKQINGLFYILSIVSFLLAISSKAVTCTLPAVILLIIWWKKDSIKLKDVLLVTPFLLLTLMIARLTIIGEKIYLGLRVPSGTFLFGNGLSLQARLFGFISINWYSLLI